MKEETVIKLDTDTYVEVPRVNILGSVLSFTLNGTLRLFKFSFECLSYNGNKLQVDCTKLDPIG